MRFSTLVASLATLASAAATNYAGGYFLINPTDGPGKLATLAANAATLPINRLFLSFLRPDMVYVPGSNTLSGTGLGYGTSGDYGFADLKEKVATLQAGGVEVFVSVGGWNYNCWPYSYATYSVAGYGTSTPNYWKVATYGDLSGCNDSNNWCYVCEPPSENTTLADFTIFPEPANSATWKAAQKYVAATAGGGAPVWHPQLIGGASYKDPKNGKTVIVPGTSEWSKLNRDPYADMVSLAKDLGLTGVDLDYEEMWHADQFKVGTGPWTLPHTIYKYTAICKDIMLNIEAQAPGLKLSTASSAAGGLSTKWWGGNLKGVWYFQNLWYPEVTKFMTSGPNAGGFNVMTYDLSNNNQYHECPAGDNTPCALRDQVEFYMKGYKDAGIPAYVGYEIGTPAYPDFAHDPTHQLPLTKSELSAILTKTQPAYTGGFFWELFKSKGVADTTANEAAKAICAAVLGANTPRCSGSIPPYNPVPTTAGPTTSSAPTTDAPVTSFTPTTRGPTTTVAPTPKPTTPKPTATTPTTKPTPAPTSNDKCGGNHNVCYWPLTNQVVPYNQAQCALFGSSFIWCP